MVSSNLKALNIGDKKEQPNYIYMLQYVYCYTEEN